MGPLALAVPRRTVGPAVQHGAICRPAPPMAHDGQKERSKLNLCCVFGLRAIMEQGNLCFSAAMRRLLACMR
jgi:hypothetical protein